MKKEIDKILEYIEEHIREELSLDLLAKQLHYSTTYISRMFNRYVGLGLNEYINRRRLSLVAIDIRRKTKSISYLANYYGFNSQKYFSNMFKKIFGITPSSYQKGNEFIALQAKRIIKGDKNMVINTVKELCKELSNTVADENTLYDKVSEISNVELFDMKDSDVQLVGYFVNEEQSYIYEISLNLMNGLFAQKTIFFVNKKKHSIKAIEKDEEAIVVTFEDIKTKKQIKAILHQGSQPKVIMQTDVQNDLRVYGKYPTKVEYDNLMRLVGALKGKIIKQTNTEEIHTLVKEENDLVLLRHFGHEFVFVKLLRGEGFFQLESIYTDMSTKFIESYSFFSSYVDAKHIEMKKRDVSLEVYCDGSLYGKSYIYGGDELTSSIFIKFPSGMSGTGGWDITPEFK